ncbi:UNVERIFIED_CONTAM: B-cell receptor-associated protein 29, partial [Eudyptes robustus]
MRLFRSQRNLYISGFALLLFIIINRLVTLISRTAALQASADAALKQAQSANQAAKTLMEAGDDEALQKTTKEVEDLKKKLRQAEKDRDAMKKQSENLQNEYERVSTLLNKKEAAGGDKKSD